jgi:hypothetical protein
MDPLAVFTKEDVEGKMLPSKFFTSQLQTKRLLLLSKKKWLL